MSSDTGLMVDREIELDYALVPHTGDWRQGEVYSPWSEFNNPLLCRKSGIHTGKLPKVWGLLEVSKPNVVITALKQAKDGSTIPQTLRSIRKGHTGVTIKARQK